MNNYRRYTAIIDNFAGYENLMGFSLGDQVFRQSMHSQPTPRQ